MSIDKIIKSAKSRYGEDVLLFDELDEFSAIKNWVSTGLPDLDLFLNTLGLPAGKIVENSGDPQSGKTSLSLHALKQVQKMDGIGILISSERRDNKIYAKEIGIDTSKILVYKTKTIEDSFSKIKESIELIRENSDDMPALIVWDSLGGTPTKAELNAKEDQDFMAVAARVIKKNLRVVTQMIDDAQISLLINNQTYSKLGQMFGKKKTSYGGDAVKFHSSIRFEVVKIKTLKMTKNGKDFKFGQTVRFEILKSDYSSPARTVDIDLLFGYGYVPSELSFDLALETGVLDKYKKGYVLVKIPKYKWSSKNDYYTLCMEDSKFRNLFTTIMLKKAKQKVLEVRGL